MNVISISKVVAYPHPLALYKTFSVLCFSKGRIFRLQSPRPGRYINFNKKKMLVQIRISGKQKVDEHNTGSDLK